MRLGSILYLPNDILTGVVDSVLQFNFIKPKENVKPYLTLFEQEEVPLKISDRRIVLNNQVKLHFSDPSTTSIIQKKNLENLDNFFITLTIDEDFLSIYQKLKKIGNKFEKIYLFVENNELFIESTDRNNPNSNGIKFKLCDVEVEDIVFAFNFKLFSQVMSVIWEDFSFNLASLEDSEAGLIKINNENEQYFIISEMI